MATTLTIQDSTNTVKFLASSSDVGGYSFTEDDANHKIILQYNKADNATPRVSLAYDMTAETYIANSILLEVLWVSSNIQSRQYVVINYKDSYGGTWKADGTTLTLSNPYKTLSNGKTVTVTPLNNSASIPTVPATKIAISNYWISNTSPDGTASGSWNKPATIKRGDSSADPKTDYPYLVSWTKPNSSEALVGYLLILWKGWNDRYNDVAAMKLVGPNTTEIVLSSQYYGGAEGTLMKHTIFAIYGKGVYPAISTLNTDSTGENTTERNKSTIKPYSIYAQFGTPPTLYTVSCYLPDGSTYIQVGDKDYWYNTVSGAKALVPSGTDWIPAHYVLDGWYSKSGSGSWGTTLLTTAQANAITVTNNLSFKAKLSLEKYTITWKNYDGTVLKTDSFEYGTVPSYSGATPTKQETGYTNTFSGWSPTPSAASRNISYTATFTRTPIRYNIFYDIDDDVINNNPTSYTIEDTIVLSEPTRKDYTFVSWLPSNTIQAGNTGAKTFTATWQYNYRRIWVYTGTKWERGMPWIYDGQGWKKSKSFYIYDNEWKEGTQ